MDNSEQISSQTTNLLDQKSLTLHWRWFSAWGFYRVTFSFAYKGCEYIVYGLQHGNWVRNNLLTRPNIVDTALTLIFSIGLLPCEFLFCLSGLPIRWLWITARKLCPKQLTYKTKNGSGSIGAHFPHGAVTVSLSFLPVKAADTFVMDNSEQIALQLTHLPDRKLLTLQRYSFSESGCYPVAVGFAYRSWQCIDYG